MGGQGSAGHREGTQTREFRYICACGWGIWIQAHLVGSTNLLMPWLSYQCFACGAQYVVDQWKPDGLVSKEEFLKTRAARAYDHTFDVDTGKMVRR